MGNGKLDKDTIVSAALDILRARGLADVTLRNVAKAVNARAPSLYWHIANKEALYGLMAEAIYRDCLAQVGQCSDWSEWLRAFGMILWRTQRDVRDMRNLIMQSAVDPETLGKLRVTVESTLERLGMDRRLAGSAAQSVQAMVTGWTMLEYDVGAPDSVAEGKFVGALDALIRGLKSG